MKKITEKLIIVGMILLCACIFPISLVRKSQSIDPYMGEPFERSDYTVQELKQIFVAQAGYLEKVAFDVGFSDKPVGGVFAYA